MPDKYLLEGFWEVQSRSIFFRDEWLDVAIIGETIGLVFALHCIIYNMLHLQQFFTVEDRLNLEMLGLRNSYFKLNLVRI